MAELPMVDDKKLAADESRRIAQHESVKGAVRENVHAEISREAAQSTPSEHAQAERLAESLRHKAVQEVAVTESELERGKAIARVSQVVDYIFYLVYGVIGLEIVLNALGARQSAGFKQFIDAMGAPFLGPFRGLLLEPGIGRFRLMTSYILALGVYVLLHMAVNGLLRLFVHRKTAV
jgi:uncharacterized protein YggT (Ycf19 family)